MTESKVRKIQTLIATIQVSSVGVVPSADSRVPHPSPPSNDSNNVGKSVTDGRTSDFSQNSISHQSAGIPSSAKASGAGGTSHVEADGSQNGGNRNDESSAQQEGQSLNPNSTSSDSNVDYSQKSNGYSNPNGFHSNEGQP